MNKNKYSDNDIIAFLERAARGENIKDICSEANISLATFYNWRNKFFCPDADTSEYERSLADENEHLREKVQRLIEEKQILLQALKARR